MKWLDGPLSLFTLFSFLLCSALHCIERLSEWNGFLFLIFSCFGETAHRNKSHNERANHLWTDQKIGRPFLLCISETEQARKSIERSWQWLKIRFLSLFSDVECVIATQLLAGITAFYASVQSRKRHNKRNRKKTHSQFFSDRFFFSSARHLKYDWCERHLNVNNPRKQITFRCEWNQFPISIHILYRRDTAIVGRNAYKSVAAAGIVDLYLHHNRISTYFLS